MCYKINYKNLVNLAMHEVVKNALTTISKQKILGNVHIIIVFSVNYPNIVLPSYLKNDYPDKMTIVLQHQFYNLTIYDNYFSVVLKFKGKEENISIPFGAIVKYIDKKENFALDLQLIENQKTLSKTEQEKTLSKTEQDNIIFIDFADKKN